MITIKVLHLTIIRVLRQKQSLIDTELENGAELENGDKKDNRKHSET